MTTSFSFWIWKNFETRQMWQLHNLVSVLNITVLSMLRGLSYGTQVFLNKELTHVLSRHIQDIFLLESKVVIENNHIKMNEKQLKLAKMRIIYAILIWWNSGLLNQQHKRTSNIHNDIDKSPGHDTKWPKRTTEK